MNLIRIAQKLSRFFTRQNRASDVLSELIRDKKHREFFNAVKPLDGIKLAFLINGVNKGLDLESMLVEIENNLISFTVVPTVHPHPRFYSTQHSTAYPRLRLALSTYVAHLYYM